jgi:flagellin
MATAINAVAGQTGVQATANATVVTGTAGLTAVNVDGVTNQIWVDGVNIGPVNILANDSDGALQKAINQTTNQTGVAATVDMNGKLVLTAKDGRNITVKVVNAGAGTIGATNLGMAAADGANWTSSGNYTLVSDSSFSVTGNAPGKAGLSALTTAVDLTTSINTVSLTTQANATQAIIKTDYALRQVNSIRADLGAVTNRLEVTVSNLTTISENLAASDSRIRDADFAYETAQLTKNQILQQAGVAILAQANTTPQAALTLLKQ